MIFLELTAEAESGFDPGSEKELLTTVAEKAPVFAVIQFEGLPAPVTSLRSQSLFLPRAPPMPRTKI